MEPAGDATPARQAHGTARKHSLREIADAMFYLVRSGCPWRYLPGGFPPWQTVYSLFRAWERDGTWEQINRSLTRQARTRAGREVEASAGVIVSQSVTTTRKGAHGYDGGKRVNGRERHPVVDIVGHLLKISSR